MTYTLTVKTAAGVPVPAAYVTFSAQGVQLQQLATDANGQIQLDSDTDAALLQVGVTVAITAPGLNTYTFQASSITGNMNVTLTTGPAMSTVVMIGAAIIGAWLIFGKKK